MSRRCRSGFATSPSELRRTARFARSAYGPKDSIRDSLPEEVTEPFLRAIDRLLKALARHEVEAR